VFSTLALGLRLEPSRKKIALKAKIVFEKDLMYFNTLGDGLQLEDFL
jgi:hypothetical protein